CLSCDNLSDATTITVLLHNNNFLSIVRTITDVERSLIPVEIQTIKRRVLYNPLCDFEHTLIGDNKIDRRSKPFTNRLPTCVQLTTCVLIEYRGNATGNVFGQFT